MVTKRDDDPPQPVEVDVRAAGGLGIVVDTAWITENLRKTARALTEREDTHIRRLNVLVVDDDRMAHLHERHSGLRETTDVLTFDLRDNRSQPIEADIVVCADEAARRGHEFNHSVEQELLLYCVHGLLHCAGYDDHQEADWRTMHSREDELLNTIGVGETFHRSIGDAKEGDSRGAGEDRP